MRKFLMLATLAAVVLASGDSHAAIRRVRGNSAPAGNTAVSDGSQSAGPVGRLMEMERRKNAALRQMFFGR